MLICIKWHPRSSANRLQQTVGRVPAPIDVRRIAAISIKFGKGRDHKRGFATKQLKGEFGSIHHVVSRLHRSSTDRPFFCLSGSRSRSKQSRIQGTSCSGKVVRYRPAFRWTNHRSVAGAICRERRAAFHDGWHPGKSRTRTRSGRSATGRGATSHRRNRLQEQCRPSEKECRLREAISGIGSAARHCCCGVGAGASSGQGS